MFETFSLEFKSNCRFTTIFSSPHSGSNYPKRFLENSSLDILELRSSEDAFVGNLFDVSANYNSALIEAIYPRCFIDLNRSHLELDPKLVIGKFKFESTPRNSVGLGVIPRLSGRGNCINKKPISLFEARERLNQFYFPYHKRLSELIMTARSSLGCAILFDCHSMPSSFNPFDGSQNKTNNTDIILGDLNGVSCDPQLTKNVKEIFEFHGFSVKLNQPFAGGFITKNYGHPNKNIHALQIEINRNLYMNELLLEPNENYVDFKNNLEKVIKELCSLTIFDKLFELAAE